MNPIKNINTSGVLKRLFLPLTLLFTLNACTPDDKMDPEFPYFKMEVDGEIWEPSGASIGGGRPFNITYRSDLDGFINVSALSISDPISNFNLSAEGAYLGESVFKARGATIQDTNNSNECGLYELDSSKNILRFEILELNEETNRIKVAFEFDAFDKCGKKHEIRNGIVYRTHGL